MRIFVTGNTIVDSIFQNIEFANKQHYVFDEFEIQPKGFFLLSLHRQENVDDPKRFKKLVKAIKIVRKEFGLPVIYPIHPRAKKMAKRFNIDFGKIDLIKPVDYLTFLLLEKNAHLFSTDSGGVQEETCILKVPCVTLRDSTERPETIEVGSNVISGTEPKKILSCVNHMVTKKRKWKNPFGSGKSTSKIVKILVEKLN